MDKPNNTDSPPPAEWLMKRNCSLSPRQALLVYALLCTATLGIAVVFTVQGAWMVLAFALVEAAYQKAGKVKPIIFKTFPLKEAAASHALMESSAHIGKIVLTI